MSSVARNLTPGEVEQRINALDWQHIRRELDDVGNSILGEILSLEECQAQNLAFTRLMKD
jgi:hypothetical protein